MFVFQCVCVCVCVCVSDPGYLKKAVINQYTGNSNKPSSLRR